MTGTAVDGRGLRRTGVMEEKGFRAAESEGRRCREAYSFGGGGGGIETAPREGRALSATAMARAGSRGWWMWPTANEVDWRFDFDGRLR